MKKEFETTLIKISGIIYGSSAQLFVINPSIIYVKCKPSSWEQENIRDYLIQNNWRFTHFQNENSYTDVFTKIIKNKECNVKMDCEY